MKLYLLSKVLLNHSRGANKLWITLFTTFSPTANGLLRRHDWMLLRLDDIPIINEAAAVLARVITF